MQTFRSRANVTGWIVFAIATIVYWFSIERTGSLWDCGEFILGAYKMQVVHPPGAPLFILIGRIFSLFGEAFGASPAHIAMAVNFMSGVSTAAAAAMVAWTTQMLAHMALYGRDPKARETQHIAVHGAGLTAGLSTAFITSIYFSGVEGEVYAMSTFFTALTIWAMVKFYFLPEGKAADRWMIFAVFASGLSIGVHLLSLLAWPALCLLYYYKKHKNINILGALIAMGVGVLMIAIIQKLVIVGIPSLWAMLDIAVVNNLGMPVLSGIIPTVLLLGGLFYFGLRMARKRGSQLLQHIVTGLMLISIGFSTYGVVVLRAGADTPVNMNNPSDPTRLIPYLNREQYGERPLLYGPDFDTRPVDYDFDERYGLVDDHYEIVDYKVRPVYRNSDKSLFPRMGDNTMGRPGLYRQWINKNKGSIHFADNVKYFFKYQIGWMYWRYFMWNFAGRQNGQQGFYSWDKKNGHWLSGIDAIDGARLYNMSDMPSVMRNEDKRNTYYFIPLLLGLLGLIWHARNKSRDFLALLALFIITGIGIIIYSNQPPNEPRERDYVLVGSFMVYCMWIGMGVLALWNFLKDKISPQMAAIAASVVGLLAPSILLTQNYDDHSRRLHSGARDYSINFLESCEPNALIFTYGDNDTYPLWYAQEVEGIRTDVRVINLSLINVDWYIDQLRRRVNESPAIKMSIPSEKIRGYRRNQIPVVNDGGNKPIDLRQALKINAVKRDLGGTGPIKLESLWPSANVYLPVDKARALASGWAQPGDSIVSRIDFKLNQNSLLKGDLAMLDIIANNAYDRPIYYSVTTQQEKLLGAEDYMQLEGLALRLVPVKSASDKQFLIYGNGRVDTDKVHDRMMNKFKWGGFDTHDTYVDGSYSPSIGAHRMVLWRTIDELVRTGDRQKAKDLIDLFFSSFPDMNFPFDSRIVPFIRAYLALGEKDLAKEKLRVLAGHTAEYMAFFDSLDEEDRQMSWRRDIGFWNSSLNQIFDITRIINDPAFSQEMNDLLGSYRPQANRLQQ